MIAFDIAAVKIFIPRYNHGAQKSKNILDTKEGAAKNILRTLICKNVDEHTFDKTKLPCNILLSLYILYYTPMDYMYLCMCFYKVHTSCLLLPCCSKLPLKSFYLLLLRFASFMKIIYGNCWPKIKDTLYFASVVQQTHIPNLLEDKCLFISEHSQNNKISVWFKIHLDLLWLNMQLQFSNYN